MLQVVALKATREVRLLRQVRLLLSCRDDAAVAAAAKAVRSRIPTLALEKPEANL